MLQSGKKHAYRQYNETLVHTIQEVHLCSGAIWIPLYTVCRILQSTWRDIKSTDIVITVLCFATLSQKERSCLRKLNEYMMFLPTMH